MMFFLGLVIPVNFFSTFLSFLEMLFLSNVNLVVVLIYEWNHGNERIKRMYIKKFNSMSSQGTKVMVITLQ